MQTLKGISYFKSINKFATGINYIELLKTGSLYNAIQGI